MYRSTIRLEFRRGYKGIARDGEQISVKSRVQPSSSRRNLDYAEPGSASAVAARLPPSPARLRRAGFGGQDGGQVVKDVIQLEG